MGQASKKMASAECIIIFIVLKLTNANRQRIIIFAVIVFIGLTVVLIISFAPFLSHLIYKDRPSSQSPVNQNSQLKSPNVSPTSEAPSNSPRITELSPKSDSIAQPISNHSNPAELTVIVNKKHPLNPIDFVPPDLTGYNSYLLSGKMLADLKALLFASVVANTPVDLYSTYRSYNNQIVAYNHWVQVNGSTSAADRVSARPGYSEHQTGFAIDFSFGNCYLDCFNDSPQYHWMQKNAAAYGFIERYPPGFESITGYSPESWHWRYVGPEIAKDMQAKNIKTLEQLWNIQGGDY